VLVLNTKIVVFFISDFVKFVHLCLEQDRVQNRRGNPVYN